MISRNFFLVSKILLVVGVTLAPNVSAENSYSQQEAALDMIVKFSDDMCEAPPLAGGTSGVALTGEAQVKLKGLIKKLADLGVSVAMDYKSSNYEGVLQKDLANLLNKAADCRMSIWNDLKDKLNLGASKKVQKSERTYQEILIQDQNPTNLVIDRVEIQNLAGSSEPYVVAIIKNPSNVTAKNVKISFRAAGGSKLTGMGSINKEYYRNNLAIASGKEGIFPIAPLSEYVNKVYPESKNSEIIEFLNLDEPKISFEQQNKVCSKAKKNYTFCHYETAQRSTIVKFNFRTIFGGQVTKTEQFFNVFLKGNVNAS